MWIALAGLAISAYSAYSKGGGGGAGGGGGGGAIVPQVASGGEAYNTSPYDGSNWTVSTGNSSAKGGGTSSSGAVTTPFGADGNTLMMMGGLALVAYGLMKNK